MLGWAIRQREYPVAVRVPGATVVESGRNFDTCLLYTSFRHTLVHYKEYFDYIGRFTKNWDVERIAFMDNLIMAATMSELINFPSIPVKVTLDEFIEIAKYYSTPGSSTFINGILDKVVEALREEGKIARCV